MRRLNSDDGTVAVLVAIMLTVLVGAGALVLDVGAMYAQEGRVQAGADAAAVALANLCVSTGATAPACNDEQTASAFALDLVQENAAGSSVVSADLVAPTATAGTVTVTGRSTIGVVFAGVLGFDDHTVNASATARWGPVLNQHVFPLAVCEGALDDVIATGDPVTLQSFPLSTDPPQVCDGAPDAFPFGWITPTGPNCTIDVSLSPTTYLDITRSDVLPAGCGGVLQDLHNLLVPAAAASADERTRVIAVYDAGTQDASGRHPVRSFVALEWLGQRLGANIRPPLIGTWDEPCSELGGPLIAELQCVYGRVRTWTPPEDAPVADDVTLGQPGVSDSTVLDVRLVD